jgi:hypothetical protein
LLTGEERREKLDRAVVGDEDHVGCGPKAPRLTAAPSGIRTRCEFESFGMSCQRRTNNWRGAGGECRYRRAEGLIGRWPAMPCDRQFAPRPGDRLTRSHADERGSTGNRRMELSLPESRRRMGLVVLS